MTSYLEQLAAELDIDGATLKAAVDTAFGEAQTRKLPNLQPVEWRIASLCGIDPTTYATARDAALKDDR